MPQNFALCINSLARPEDEIQLVKVPLYRYLKIIKKNVYFAPKFIYDSDQLLNDLILILEPILVVVLTKL